MNSKFFAQIFPQYVHGSDSNHLSSKMIIFVNCEDTEQKITMKIRPPGFMI